MAFSPDVDSILPAQRRHALHGPIHAGPGHRGTEEEDQKRVGKGRVQAHRRFLDQVAEDACPTARQISHGICFLDHRHEYRGRIGHNVRQLGGDNVPSDEVSEFTAEGRSFRTHMSGNSNAD